MLDIKRHFDKVKEKIDAESFYEVPPYKVGSNQLLFYYEGLLCVTGENFQYDEVGDKGTISTKIQIHFDVAANDEITTIVISFIEKEEI